MKYQYHYFLLLASFLFFVSGCNPKPNDNLTIATSANMQYAIKELVASFESIHNKKCHVVIGSSGKLTAQIIEGAPYHILISANEQYPLSLEKAGLTTTSPIVFAHGGLIIWSAKKDIEPSLDLITTHKIRHIAIANPKTAPYGEAAVQLLNHYQLLDEVKHKLVYGESIAQVNQFVMTGAAEIGITAQSILASPGVNKKGQWVDIDPEAYQPIPQTIVVINRDKDMINSATAFKNFLSSDVAIQILNRHRYR